MRSKSVEQRQMIQGSNGLDQCCRIFSGTWMAGSSGNRKIGLCPEGEKDKQKVKGQKEAVIKE